MIVEFTKSRGFMGRDSESFEARLANGIWSERSASNARDEQIIQMHLESLPQRDIMREVGCGLATVNRTIKAYKSGMPMADNDE